MTGFKLTEYDKGKKLFTIRSDKFYIRNKKVKPFNFRAAVGKSVEMEGVEVVYYKDGRPFSYINSALAIMDNSRRDIVFKGSPSLATADRRTLSARKMTWDNSGKRLLARGNCLLGSDGKILEARFVNTDAELRNFTVSDK